MLSLIVSLFSSSAMGSLIGWIGGLLNRKIDLAAKKDEYTYNLGMRDKDLEQTQAEVTGRVAVADKAVEEAKATAEGLTEQAAYNAMAESYKEQAKLLGGKWAWVDAASKIIRPLVTVIFVVVSLTISVYIIYKALQSGVTFSVDDWKEWVTYVIRWVFFQAGVVIGWWFANRPAGRK
jgi:hypothetical protein